MCYLCCCSEFQDVWCFLFVFMLFFKYLTSLLFVKLSLAFCQILKVLSIMQCMFSLINSYTSLDLDLILKSGCKSLFLTCMPELLPILRFILWNVWGRASHHQKLVPTIPWKDNCLMVTDWDFLKMEASLWLNEKSLSVAKGWFSTLCCWEAVCPYLWLIFEENGR